MTLVVPIGRGGRDSVGREIELSGRPVLESLSRGRIRGPKGSVEAEL